MKPKKSKTTSVRLVVDTNVLRGASNTTTANPPGSTLRAVLEAILKICHCAVVSPELALEYSSHASNYGERWLKAMRTKGKVIDVDVRSTSRSRRWQQSDSLSSAQQREELDKDLHLVLAAIQTDGIVVSCETRVRDLLRKVMTEKDADLIGWAVVGKDTVDWLERGALRFEVAIAGE